MYMTDISEIREKTLDPDDRYVDISGISEQIKKSREINHISRLKAAAYCGVSETTFVRWEYGVTRKIKQRFYKKLEKIIDGTAEFNR